MLTVSGIIETALYVDDMQRSVTFYEQVFGLSTLLVSERLTALRVAPGQVLLIMRRGLSSEASVLPFGVIPPSDSAGQQHVAFGVRPDDLDRWRERLRRHEVVVESAIGWPEGGQSLYVRDPDHHSVELKSSDWNGESLPSAGLSHPG